MTYKLKPLIDPTQLAGTVATIYTCPSGNVAGISQAYIHNPNSITYKVTIHLVPSGDSADPTNKIWNLEPIGPNESLPIDPLINAVLEAGDTIQAFADTASKVNIFASGFERTQS